ncbi:hypothetical protein SPLC1_S080150 [Arthrospira platensis C1]|nr:hypothetical protein SPLC1_S080150 [Arthrospira platensis C1]
MIYRQFGKISGSNKNLAIATDQVVKCYQFFAKLKY